MAWYILLLHYDDRRRHMLVVDNQLSIHIQVLESEVVEEAQVVLVGLDSDFEEVIAAQDSAGKIAIFALMIASYVVHFL